ncbi:class I SAM-dependent methyltransferase [Plantactinospora siamensis]|uniref:S-adenosyl-L-methionine-dependent methyltransferase n=1 Tax=Plantactinospora siamensis TaxID=555372 RepID=A0ABV6P1G2_9ACTN
MANPDVRMTGTATWIAAARARESARADRLFADPWAESLAGSTGAAWLTASERAGSGENRFLPVRTRFFDDVLLDNVDRAEQIVLLGAGLDTRAYRLPLPRRLTVFELDLPEPLSHKETVLAAAAARPACRRVAVPADFRGDWTDPLVAAGFDPLRRTAWLAEGLLCHLDPASVRGLLVRAAELSQAGAVLAADLFGTGLLGLPGTRGWIEQRRRAGEPAPFCTDRPAALLAETGWPRCELTEPGQPAANFGRLAPVPPHWSGGADPTLRTYLAVARTAG